MCQDSAVTIPGCELFGRVFSAALVDSWLKKKLQDLVGGSRFEIGNYFSKIFSLGLFKKTRFLKVGTFKVHL